MVLAMTQNQKSDLGERIMTAAQARGLSQSELARSLGVTAGAIWQWKTGKTSPSHKNLLDLCKVLGVSMSYLVLGNDVEKPIDESASENVTNATQREDRRGISENLTSKPDRVLPGSVEFARKIPIYGQAMGGPDGRFILNGETMGFILAPTSLSNIRNAYAVYVVGESMEPRYEAGEVCWVNPHIPVRAGHYVVVQIAGAADGDPPEGYVKRFVARTADVLRLEQFNPPKVIEIPNEKVLSVHRIVGSGEAN